MDRTTLATRMWVAVLGTAMGALGCAHADRGGFANGEGGTEDDTGSIDDASGDAGSSTSSGGTTSTAASSTSTTASGAGATTSSSGDGGSSVSSGATSGGGHTCDGSGDCGSCANCSVGDQCADEADLCANDQQCLDLVNCLSSCQDQACANDCASQNPNGMNLYMNLTICAFCDACPIDCAADSQGLCSP